MGLHYLQLIKPTNVFDAGVIAQARATPNAGLKIVSIHLTRDTARLYKTFLDIRAGSPGGEVSIYTDEAERPAFEPNSLEFVQTGLDIPINPLDSIKLLVTNPGQTGTGNRVTAILGLSDNQSIGRVWELAPFSTPSLAAGAIANLNITLFEALAVCRVTTNSPAWIRAYATNADRVADSGRASATPPPNSGILLDVLTTPGNLTAQASRAALLFNGDSPASKIIYFAIQNKNTSPGIISTTLRKMTI